jgi:hypothetical protein
MSFLRRSGWLLVWLAAGGCCFPRACLTSPQPPVVAPPVAASSAPTRETAPTPAASLGRPVPTAAEPPNAAELLGPATGKRVKQNALETAVDLSGRLRDRVVGLPWLEVITGTAALAALFASFFCLCLYCPAIAPVFDVLGAQGSS